MIVPSARRQAMHLQNQATVNARAHAAAVAGRSRFVALLSLTLTVLVFLTLAGCRRGMPVDTAPQAATPADGTLHGTIRGSAGSIPVEGRTVEVVNVATGQSQRVTTGGSGGFSMRLTPGGTASTSSCAPVNLSSRDRASSSSTPAIPGARRLRRRPARLPSPRPSLPNRRRSRIPHRITSRILRRECTLRGSWSSRCSRSTRWPRSRVRHVQLCPAMTWPLSGVG